MWEWAAGERGPPRWMLSTGRIDAVSDPSGHVGRHRLRFAEPAPECSADLFGRRGVHCGMSALTVHATLLAARSVSRTVELSQVAAAQLAGGSDIVFYPSAIPIPAPGTWELTASTGPNRGCFIVTFSAPGP